jgi:hypothetical protein
VIAVSTRYVSMIPAMTVLAATVPRSAAALLQSIAVVVIQSVRQVSSALRIRLAAAMFAEVPV